MSDHLEILTAAANEAIALLDVNPNEAAGILRAAVADVGYVKPRTPLRRSMVVGVCSSCAGDVVRHPGHGASCACGTTSIPETFRGVMAGATSEAG